MPAPRLEKKSVDAMPRFIASLRQMRDKVNCLDAAMDWFLSNAEGSVICVDGETGQERECSSFIEAQAFYTGKADAGDDDVDEPDDSETESDQATLDDHGARSFEASRLRGDER